jgi:insertion element IS1 protein InsB
VFLYAYYPESKQIVAMVCGTRGAATVRKLYSKIEHLPVDWYCTDNWKAFATVLPYDRHLIGKKYTKAIEGVNTNLRTRNKRMMRRTTCFSKKEDYHLAAMRLTVTYFNNHTF